MPRHATLSHELSALQNELSSSRRERAGLSDREPPPKKDRPHQTEDAAEEGHIAAQLQDLVDHIKEFAEEAEQNIAEHPTATVVGALLLGILIGRLLAKR